MNGYSSLIIYVSVCHIRLNRKVGLSGTIGINFYHIRSSLHNGRCILSFDTVCFIINIRCSGMNFYGIRIHCFRSRHICWKKFQIHFYFLRCCFCMSNRICTNHCNGITILENLLITENRTVPSISFIGWEGNQTCNPVLSGYILIGNDLIYTGHIFCF